MRRPPLALLTLAPPAVLGILWALAAGPCPRCSMGVGPCKCPRTAPYNGTPWCQLAPVGQVMGCRQGGAWVEAHPRPTTADDWPKGPRPVLPRQSSLSADVTCRDCRAGIPHSFNSTAPDTVHFTQDAFSAWGRFLRA